MTQGTLIVITEVIRQGDGYTRVPRREGEVVGHPVGRPDLVYVDWWDTDDQSEERTVRQLRRTEEMERWAVDPTDGPHTHTYGDMG